MDKEDVYSICVYALDKVGLNKEECYASYMGLSCNRNNEYNDNYIVLDYRKIPVNRIPISINNVYAFISNKDYRHGYTAYIVDCLSCVIFIFYIYPYYTMIC